MEFYYSDGVQSLGPFPLEQLKTKNITRNTLVWHTGMADWKPAGEVPALAELFTAYQGSVPPPTYQQPQMMNTGTPPKTWLLESILVTLFCCLPFGIAGIVNASKVEGRYYAGDQQGALKASQEAGKWTKIGFFSGLAVGVLYLIFVVAMGVGGLSEFSNF